MGDLRLRLRFRYQGQLIVCADSHGYLLVVLYQVANPRGFFHQSHNIVRLMDPLVDRHFYT